MSFICWTTDLGFLNDNGRDELILQIIIDGDFEDNVDKNKVKNIENWKAYSLV